MDLGEQGAAGDRDDAVVRGAPAELLSDFEPEGLGAFGVIGTDIDVHECPFEGVGDLRAEAVDLVVIALDPHDRGLANPGADDFALL